VYQGIEKLYPFTGGHEIAGEIVEIGCDVEPGLAVGDRVTVSALKRCGQCVSCREGNNNLCDHAYSKPKPAEPYGPQGLAEYLATPAYGIYKLSSDVPLTEASLAEPLSCVLRSIKRANIRPGDTVVIMGGGFMGLLHLMLAKQRAASVVVSEPNAARLAKAAELGADVGIDPTKEDLQARVMDFTARRGAETIIVAGSPAKLIEDAVGLVAKNGCILSYASTAPSGATITLPAAVFHKHEITLAGTMSSTQEDFREATAILSRRALNVKPLITRTFPLSEIGAAFEAATSGEAYRIVVTM
jgi:threonine dehydrogenase-like Zn-dependent dehydrogenase